MFRTFLLLIIYLLVSLPAFTQSTLTGKVYDAKGKPLVGASVQILSLNKGDVSDIDGSFRIENLPKGKLSIKATSIGYKEQTKTITLKGKTTSINFKLKQDAVRHKEVVISAQKNTREIKEIRESPMAVSVIAGEKLRGSTSGIEDVLNKISGIKIRQSGGLGSKARVSIHGLEGKRVAIFINGFALNSPDGSFDINDLPIDVIDRIEVYKGIVPAEYGSDGLGGAINIVTREVDCDLVGFTYERGSYNREEIFAAVKKRFDDPGIQLGVAYLSSSSNNNYNMNLLDFDPYWPQGTPTTVRRNNDYYMSKMWVLQAVFTKLWFDEIEFEFAFYDNEKEYQAITFDSRYAYTHGSNFMPIFKLEKEDFFLEGLDFKSSFVSPVVKTHLVDTSRFIHQWNGEITPALGETSDGYLNNSENKYTEALHKLNLKYQLTENHRLNLNNQFRYSKFTPKDNYMIGILGYDPSGFPSKMTGNVTGLTYEYISSNKRFHNSLAVKFFHLNSKIYSSFGLSHSDTITVKKTPAKTSNELTYYGFSEGVSYEIIPDLRLKTSFEHAVRLPDTEELFGNGISINSSINLKPEESNNFNFGFLIDKLDFLGFTRFQFESNLFYMNTSNLIGLVFSNKDGRLAYVNLDKTLIKGVDAELKVDFTKNIYSYFNITYQSLRDNLEWIDDDKTTPNPTYDLRVPNIPWLYYNYGFELHGENWFGDNELTRLYVNGSYVHQFSFNWEVSNREDQIIKWRIPSYMSIDLGFQQSFLDNQLSIAAEVTNLLDDNIYNEYKLPLEGRMFTLKLRYNWFRDRTQGGAMGF